MIANITTTSGSTTMSSLEIAELTGKEHFHVRRDISNTLTEAGIDPSRFGLIETFGNNRTREIFNLPRLECDLVISGYSVKYRLAIIKRWHELESGAALPNRGNLHDLNETTQRVAREEQMLGVGKFFANTIKDLSGIGLSRQAQAAAANQIVRRVTGIDYLDMAGNPHFTLAQDELFPRAPAARAVDAAAAAQQKQLDRLVICMRKSLRYCHTKYQPAIQDKGVMTHSQLLRAVHMPAVEFADLVALAVDKGVIQKISGQPYGYGGTVYTLTGSAK